MQIDEQIAMVIEPGEQVVWKGRPTLLPYVWQGPPSVMVCMSLILVALWAISQLFPSRAELYDWVWVIPVLIVGFAVAVAVVQFFEYRRLWYVMTNRRIILGQLRGQKPIVVLNEEVIDVGIERSFVDLFFPGVGTVSYATEKSYRQSNSDQSMTMQRLPMRFWHVKDSKQVVKLFQGLTVSQRSPETVLWEGRPDYFWLLFSPVPLVGSVISFVVSSLINQSELLNKDFSPLELVVFVLMIWLGGYMFHRRGCRYVVTDQGVSVTGGLVGRDMHFVFYDKVKDVVVERPIWMNVLGGDIGHIQLLNGGQEKMRQSELLRSSDRLTCVRGVGRAVTIIQQQLEQSRMRKIERAASADTVAP